MMCLHPHMDKNNTIETALKALQERNERVEADKAWETSITRKMLIALVTYIVIVLFFFAAGLPKPFVNAVVPTTGYILSTLTVEIAKRAWLKKHNKEL